MDNTSVFLAGLVLGFIGGALVLTQTGKAVTTQVVTSTGTRLARYIAG